MIWNVGFDSVSEVRGLVFTLPRFSQLRLLVNLFRGLECCECIHTSSVLGVFNLIAEREDSDEISASSDKADDGMLISS